LINANAIMFSAYYDDPQTTPPEKLRLNVCMTVPEGTKVEGEIKTDIMIGAQHAVMRAELNGPEEYGPAWMKIVDWMKTNKKELDISRPCYEIYHNNPEDHPEKHHIIDICMAIL